VSSRISRDFTANANITLFVANLFYCTTPTLSEHKIRYLRQFLSKRVNWFKFVKACKLGFNASPSYQSAFKLAMNCYFSSVVSEKSMTVHQKQAVENFCCLFVIRHPIFSAETIAFYLSPKLCPKCFLRNGTKHSFTSTTIREFKIWRRQRQRRRHESMIWLVEWRKLIVVQVRHAFWCNVLT